MKKKQVKETVWDGKTPIKPYTLKELKRKPIPDTIRFHFMLVGKENIPSVGLSALDPRRMRIPIAVIYKHPCGEVTVESRVALRRDAILRWILPIMEDFDRWLRVAKWAHD